MEQRDKIRAERLGRPANKSWKAWADTYVERLEAIGCQGGHDSGDCIDATPDVAGWCVHCLALATACALTSGMLDADDRAQRFSRGLLSMTLAATKIAGAADTLHNACLEADEQMRWQGRCGACMRPLGACADYCKIGRLRVAAVKAKRTLESTAPEMRSIRETINQKQ